MKVHTTDGRAIDLVRPALEGLETAVTRMEPIGSVLQYEMTHSPLANSDPMDLGRGAVVNVSSPYLGDAGHVQTFLVND